MDSSSFLEWDPELNLKKKKEPHCFPGPESEGGWGKAGGGVDRKTRILESRLRFEMLAV